MRNNHLVFVLIFAIIYFAFVSEFQLKIIEYSEIIVASVFSFTLFVGFFFSRQSERYSKIADLIATSDAVYSYLYRISSVTPRIQIQVREIVRNHYLKIIESKNWAYHIINPSSTIQKLTETFSSVTKEEENSSPAISPALENIWSAIEELQKSRKSTITLYNQKLLASQWLLICLLGTILVISIDFIPENSLMINILKMFFGTSVILAITLLGQLNNLSLFEKDFWKKSSDDVIRILDETDREK